MNGNINGQIRNHQRLIIICVTVLGLISILSGSYLILKGYQVGELLLANGGIGAITGLIGFLSSKTPLPTEPVLTKIDQPASQPIPVAEVTQPPKP